MHPPTAKLLIAGASRSSATSRGPGGSPRRSPASCSRRVFFLLARRVLATERAALFATLLLLLDGVYLVQSRIAMTNVFAVLFQLLSALLLLRAVRERAARGRATMALAGLALGLALSTRWTSLWAWGFLGLVFLAVRRRGARSGRASWRSERSRSWLLPAAVYLLSYVPWMRQAHRDGAEWWSAACGGRAAAGHLELPRQPDRHPHLLQPVVDLALALPAHLVLLVLGRGLRARHRRARQPGDLVGLGAGLAVGARDRDPLARPAARLLRRGLLPALPAVGALAAHAQLLALPLRGDPVRLPVARRCSSTAAGTRAGDPRARLPGARGGAVRAVPALPDRDARADVALGLPLPDRRRALAWFPSWI